MINKHKNSKSVEIPIVDVPSYDSTALISALNGLNRSEIESMLGNISSLETQIAKLNTTGREDAMLHLVTDGLRRLTYLLDSVKRHKDDTGQDE
jgi:hypothetical protein